MLLSLLLAASISVHDGDTIRIGEQRIRLASIDAPELSQTCGEYDCGMEAREYLAGLINGHSVTCKSNGKYTYNRAIATCYADGMDIGAEMVLQGQAVAYTKYSKAYIGQEGIARMNKRGIWRGEFVRPEIYRKPR